MVPLAWGDSARRGIQERAAQVKGDGDLLRRHHAEQARAWRTGAWQMGLETGAIAPV